MKTSLLTPLVGTSSHMPWATDVDSHACPCLPEAGSITGVRNQSALAVRPHATAVTARAPRHPCAYPGTVPPFRRVPFSEHRPSRRAGASPTGNACTRITRRRHARYASLPPPPPSGPSAQTPRLPDVCPRDDDRSEIPGGTARNVNNRSTLLCSCACTAGVYSR